MWRRGWRRRRGFRLGIILSRRIHDGFLWDYLRELRALGAIIFKLKYGFRLEKFKESESKNSKVSQEEFHQVSQGWKHLGQGPESQWSSHRLLGVVPQGWNQDAVGILRRPFDGKAVVESHDAARDPIVEILQNLLTVLHRRPGVVDGLRHGRGAAGGAGGAGDGESSG